jgi:hypothetical protein
MTDFEHRLDADGAVAQAAWHKNASVRFCLLIVGSAVVGYGVGWLIATFEDQVPLLSNLTGWANARSVTELLAVMAILMMGMLGTWLLVLGKMHDDRLRGLLKMDADDNLDRSRRMLPVAGWGMLLYAAIILIFLLPGMPPVLGIGLAAMCFAAVTWLFYRGTIMMDELEQAAQREAIIATFLILEALGIGWALLHHYALAPPLEPLAVVLAMTVIYYAAGVIAAFRRGLGR